MLRAYLSVPLFGYSLRTLSVYCVLVRLFYFLYCFLFLVSSSLFFFFLMIRRPPRSTLDRSSAASDVYKRQSFLFALMYINLNAQKKDSILYIYRSDMLDSIKFETDEVIVTGTRTNQKIIDIPYSCLLYTSDAADERSSVDLGGRRIIKKKN